MSLEISDVSYNEDKIKNNWIQILFTCKQGKYTLWVQKHKEKWKPVTVAHNDQSCRFCNHPGTWYCEKLMEDKDEIFKQLIEFPSVRLHWLFLEQD